MSIGEALAAAPGSPDYWPGHAHQGTIIRDIENDGYSACGGDIGPIAPLRRLTHAPRRTPAATSRTRRVAAFARAALCGFVVFSLLHSCSAWVPLRRPTGSPSISLLP